MGPNVTAIIVDSDGGFRKAVRQQLKGFPGVELVGEAENFAAAQELLLRTRPHLVFLELPTRPDEALAAADRWRKEHPQLRIFATSASKTPDLILTAFRSGVSEYLSKPLEVKELHSALDRVVRLIEAETAHARSAGNVIAVFSKKGGLGVTTIAVNLAVALAAAGRETVIADLAFDIGDVASQLDLEPDFRMTDILDPRGEVDPARLQGSLIRHKSGLLYLGEKEVTSTSEGITAKQLSQMLSHLRDSYNDVVLDLPHTFDAYTYEALQIADRILLVATCELSTIRATRYALQVFRSLGFDDNKVKVILNRVSRKDAISEEQFCETAGCRVAYRIPSDYRTVIEAINAGEPLVISNQKSNVARSLSEMARMSMSPNGSAPAN
ncbi:MAG TPA: AAA family ATPase [bacterium]|nr:AAA family ATPase [bacterium]